MGWKCAAACCDKSFASKDELERHYHEMGVPGFAGIPEQTPSAQHGSHAMVTQAEETGPETMTLGTAANTACDLMQCSVCFDRPPQVVMVPCGHIYACEPCGIALRTCAICRVPIARVLRVYYSSTV